MALAPGAGRQPAGRTATQADPANNAIQAFQAYGVKAVFPELNYAEVLTPQALALMPMVDTAGWYLARAVFARLPAGGVLKPSANENPYFKKAHEMSVIGARRAAGPVLILHGSADAIVPSGANENLYKEMRSAGSSVEFRELPGLDHSSLLFGSFAEQVRWVRQRFASVAR